MQHVVATIRDDSLRMKKCSVCREPKPLTAEYYYRQHDKSTGFNARCKVCDNKARKARMRDSGYTKRYAKDVYIPRVKALIKQLKEMGCSRCGYNKCKEALHFHHIGEKRFGISNRGGKGIASIKAEASRCVVLCANCHIELHANEHPPTRAEVGHDTLASMCNH